MANVPISNFTVPANTVGIGATGYSLTGSASASFVDLAGTWNTSGTPTAIKLNITNTASTNGLLMDLGTGGGSFTSRFKVDTSGNATAVSYYVGGSILRIREISGGMGLVDTDGTSAYVGYGQLSAKRFALGTDVTSPDVILSRRAAANLRLGAADAAAPVAQTLSVQSVVAGTTNTAGTNLTITGSQGTGTGAGGSIVFQVAPAGSSGTAQNALATALTIDSSRNVVVTTGSITTTSAAIQLKPYGSTLFTVDPASGVWADRQLLASESFWIGFYNGGSGQSNVRLYYDAANTLALRNGASAQTFNVYKSYTDASNYERLAIGYSSGAGAFVIQRENAGTGSAQNLLINGGSQVLGIGLAATGAVTWTINSSGHFLAGADNTYDIGASGANRPRNVYVANSLTVTGTGAFRGVTVGQPSEYLSWSGSSKINGATDGILALYNAAASDFGRLQFGGTTSSFPALKRSTTILQARLADDSAFATIQGKLRADVNAVAETPTATHTITITDAAGTAYKVLCVAA